jgi:hypothetical protein
MPQAGSAKHLCAAKLDPAVNAIAPASRLAGLRSIRHRLADLMFVELLFEKGLREVEMINEEYNWRKAILMKRDEALAPPADAAVGAGSDAEGVGHCKTQSLHLVFPSHLQVFGSP